MRTIIAVVVFLSVFAGHASAEQSWIPNVLAFGHKRAQIKATPVTERSYRPLHFYGNTVRRKHFHDRYYATPKEAAKAVKVWVLRK